VTNMAGEIANVLTKIDRDENMSAVALARTTAQALVATEERKTRSRMLAYGNVASKVGRSATWLRNLLADRLSRVDGEIKRRLDALLIREIEAEIARLTHELEMARRCGDHPAALNVCEIEAHLASARSLLGGAP
jgi:hypothetical protein